METKAQAQLDDVLATLRNLTSESEAFLATLGEEGTQRYRDAAVGLKRQIRRARHYLDDAQYAAARQARVAARRADQYVHENPWKTAGSAAAIGAAVGAIMALLITRR